jgi:catechol 2,3-dioxygenase-like lactoylglutathione lyase family enzyme
MRMTNITVWTQDPTAVRDWYAEKLGLKVAEETPRFVMLRGESGAALAFHVGEPLGTPERIQFHFEVDDVDQVYQRLVDQGVTFESPPIQRPWGVRSTTTFDPAGHSVELTSPRSQ